VIQKIPLASLTKDHSQSLKQSVSFCYPTWKASSLILMSRPFLIAFVNFIKVLLQACAFGICMRKSCSYNVDEIDLFLIAFSAKDESFFYVHLLGGGSVSIAYLTRGIYVLDCFDHTLLILCVLFSIEYQ